MARCASIDVLQQIKWDGEMEEVESSESDLEIDVPDSPELIVLDRNEDDNSNSQESIKEICSGPVLSLKCLHDDSVNKNSNSQENIKEISAGPVLSLKCLHDDSINKSSDSQKSAKEVNAGSVLQHLLVDSDDKKIDSSEITRSSTETNVEFIDINDVPELSINSDQEEEDDIILEDSNAKSLDEEHPHLVPLTVNGHSGNSNAHNNVPHSSVPARSNWEGAHNFKIKIDCSSPAKKTELAIYDEPQNKLYITKDHPFKVLVSAENVPKDSWIRVSAVFHLIEHSFETVQRCPTHIHQDYVKGVACFEHFIQCFSDAAVYEKTKSGKLSVSVLYKEPQEGETYSTYLFKLTCFNSCSGGINRRPFMLMFILEKDNIPLGRQVMKAKVCACPLRDFRSETWRRDKNKSNSDIQSNSNESSSNQESSNREPSNQESSNREKLKKTYSIAVKDPELFLFLEQMKALYETSASVSQLRPSTRSISQG